MALADDLAWFEQFKKTPRFAQLAERPVAYFCAEFALADTIPTYSGGLGVLAGDVVREAGDRGLPMIAVGLYYHQGYICKQLDDGTKVVEMCTDIAPESVGLVPVNDASGKRVTVHVPLQDRQVTAQVWRYDAKSVPVYLLDTDMDGNTDTDRAITNRLYVDDKETRLKQEVLLGIGGLRLMETLGIHPSIYHLNEGHSAFLTLELIRHQMQERHLGFAEAKQFARRRVVFTNHTLVPAGNEIYDNDLVSLMLGPYCQELGIPVSEMIAMGLVHESTTFSMTMVSMRMAGIVNGVSKLHAEKAKDVWTSHPMVGITNGVHLGTWDMQAGRDMTASGAFRAAHRERKQLLLDFIKQTTGHDWSADDLLLGWARRVTRYKRPLAILEDAARLVALAKSTGTAVRVVLAGRPHPADSDGHEMLKELKAAAEGPLKDFVVYIPEYSLYEAGLLVSGCDVWLNTPVVGFEASGTSGMKAALNGVLPCSTRDGWIAEVDLLGIGWPVDSDRIGQDLLDVVEHNIIPLYAMPDGWEQNMRNTRNMVRDRFSATRMLREYVEILYN